MRLFLVTCMVVALGCSRMQTLKKPGSGGDRQMPGASSVGGGAKGDLGRKAVYGKQDPATLVAKDGSRCAVTEQRYQETAIGELVWCSWKP
jgi:hypothetical protein